MKNKKTLLKAILFAIILLGAYVFYELLPVLITFSGNMLSMLGMLAMIAVFILAISFLTKKLNQS